MTWAQFAWLLSRRIGEVPNIISKGQAFLEASPYLPKNQAFRNLSEAFDPLCADLDSVDVATMDAIEDVAAEEALMKAMGADVAETKTKVSADVQAAGILDKLQRLKDLYKMISPWLNLIGIALPPLPFDDSKT